ncbi:MAG: polysaccharide biosynthesis protein [Phyllobacteriaceae bacterium]|nr:polysaccharide biosynthesis protein [Phyllobacteriaceae bacterium]
MKVRRFLLGLPRRQKQLLVLLFDVAAALASTWLAYLIRLERWHQPSSHEWLVYGLAATLFIPFFIRLGLYRAIFRYHGLEGFISMSRAVLFYGLAFFLALLLAEWPGVPRSIGVIQPTVFLFIVALGRLLATQYLERRQSGAAPLRNALIYGAGDSGARASGFLHHSRRFSVCGFLDDDPRKVGKHIEGLPIFGTGDIEGIIRRFQISDIIIALPNTPVERRREILKTLMELHVRVRNTPRDFENDDHDTAAAVDLDILDVLDRAPIRANIAPQFMAGRALMVTGAGGSIGSELCRQIISHNAARLILIDNSEYALYAIDSELRQEAQRLGLAVTIIPCLASIRDSARMDMLFGLHKPDIVYHAAAYKHVPLVESNPIEAASNNVIGAMNVAELSAKHGVSRFTLVSTDKAVRPTNVMGASKRCAEQIIQALSASHAGQTVFSIVRFGNVLESSGSVVPLFRKQIKHGGPVTITHPEITRYFMTIPEAVGLVIEASRLAAGGEVFLLDMGAPVRIDDLARRMIKLSGYTLKSAENPDGEIEIRVIGLRPGEKLYEELLIGNSPVPTSNPHIFMGFESFLPWNTLQAEMTQLRKAIEANDEPRAVSILNRLGGAQPNGVAA